MSGRDRVGGTLMCVTGLFALGTSAYFLFLRPPFLPEDARFTAVSTEAISPQMADWLRIVFRTWGGFMAGFGILLLANSVHLLTGRSGALRFGAALALVVAFGNFLVSNLELASDFLPIIIAEAAIAAATAGWLLLRRRSPGAPSSPS